MSAAFGVRLTDCGPNRPAVLAQVRSLVRKPPAAVKAAVSGGDPVVAIDLDLASAEGLAAEFRRLRAVAEVFVSTRCPSGEHAGG